MLAFLFNSLCIIIVAIIHSLFIHSFILKSSHVSYTQHQYFIHCTCKFKLLVPKWLCFEEGGSEGVPFISHYTKLCSVSGYPLILAQSHGLQYDTFLNALN